MSEREQREQKVVPQNPGKMPCCEGCWYQDIFAIAHDPNSRPCANPEVASAITSGSQRGMGCSYIKPFPEIHLPKAA